jgi:hypothetical protein
MKKPSQPKVARISRDIIIDKTDDTRYSETVTMLDISMLTDSMSQVTISRDTKRSTLMRPNRESRPIKKEKKNKLSLLGNFTRALGGFAKHKYFSTNETK